MGVCGHVNLGVLKYVVCVRRGYDGCYVFCLYRGVCMSMNVSSCRCCMFVSCVYHVAVIIICSLIMLVEYARGDHKEEVYSRVDFLTA